jgi:hypothetical protein
MEAGRHKPAHSIIICAVFAWFVTSCHITNKPQDYPKGSEGYYLAWIDHGSFGQKGGAARALLDLEQSRQYDLTRAMWERESGVIKQMLLLRLFEMRPSDHYKQVEALMTLKDVEFETEGSWIKTDDEFEGEIVDFFFDWGEESGLRLISHGYLSDRAVEMLLGSANSFYPDERKRAKQVFDLFAGIPPYDPEPQPQTINDTPQIRETQLKTIQQWLFENRAKLNWSSEKRVYVTRP